VNAGTQALGRAPEWFARWVARHRRWVGTWTALAVVLVLVGNGSAGVQLLAVALVPGVVAAVWATASPAGYESRIAGPVRRLGWRRWVRRDWVGLAESCGLTSTVQVVRRRDGRRVTESKTIAPRLCRVQTRGHLLELTIRARAGQTVEDVDDAAPRLASTLAAVAHRTRPISGGGSGCTTVVELVMADALTTSTTAVEPEPRAICDRVRLGHAQGGGEWSLTVRGRHTLVAGCSGAGKGSVLWGICCGLAPAVRADVVRLWGVDLKRGVELAMGSGLFSAHAYTPADALDVLRSLMGVIDERGRAMAGTTRLHEPVVGDPLHVLVIDELAALTAYADVSIRREAERLLSEILTQGRALGVVVVACVQDPRKDVVSMRGLFTQTIALRLRSPEETAMVLGEGMTRVAPAHRISPTFPGTAWVVEDTGAADRVRADFWPDDLIRDLSTRYATQVHVDTAPAPSADPVDGDLLSAQARERKPRSPRTPRAARSVDADAGMAEGAA
jgi:S-DNA-T family DNA segregation ATPase FtsK/SpoIIIE